MKVLLTGADGLLGSNLSRELISRGVDLRGTTQPGRNTWTIDGLAMERVPTDILDPAAMEAALDGCDAVIHAAAATAIWPPRSEVVRRVNIEGTKNVLAAAKKQRVKRMIHIGTANTFAAGSKDAPGDETASYDGWKYGVDYMDSKYEAHNMVMEAARKGDVPVLEVDPTFMIGPFDRAPGPGKIILRVCRDEVPGAAMGGRNCVSVKDAAVAIANALTMGNVGESYILGNVNLTYEQIFLTISDTVGVEIHPKVYRNWFVRTVGLTMSTISWFTRVEPVVSAAMSHISTDDHYYTAAKAVRELQMPQTAIEEAIHEAHKWFLDNGYVYDEQGRIPRRIPTIHTV